MVGCLQITVNSRRKDSYTVGFGEYLNCGTGKEDDRKQGHGWSLKIIYSTL